MHYYQRDPALARCRVEFGFGAGWWAREHAATGIDFSDVHDRFDRFAEQLEIIHGLWATPVHQTFTFTGRHYCLDNSPALPKPVQEGGPPIIIGGDGKTRTPGLVARWAAEYNSGWNDPAATTATFDRVRHACQRIGRNPDSLRLSSVQTLCAGASGNTLRRRKDAIGLDHVEQAGLHGDGEQLREQVDRFHAAGVQRMYIEILDLTDIDHLAFIAAEVMQ